MQKAEKLGKKAAATAMDKNKMENVWRGRSRCDRVITRGYLLALEAGKCRGREAAQALLILGAGSEEEHINLTRLALPCAVGAG